MKFSELEEDVFSSLEVFFSNSPTVKYKLRELYSNIRDIKTALGSNARALFLLEAAVHPLNRVHSSKCSILCVLPIDFDTLIAALIPS